MEIYWYIVVFVLGAIIGSFLNVVLYRLHTGKSLSGRSHCMSCGKTLTWNELFPVFSYVFQRGRCRGCHAYIPSRYLYVELLTAFSSLLIFWLFASNLFILGFYFVLLPILILVVVYDIRHTIIPDELTALVGVASLVLLGYEFLDTKDALLSVWRIVAGVSGAAFFAGLWFISKGRWIGLGDAKLALPLGVMVGIGGVFSMVVLSFWIGAIISLMIVGIQHVYLRLRFRRLNIVTKCHKDPNVSNDGEQECPHKCCTSEGVAKYRRYFTIKSEVPFAPFLVIGFLLVQLFHADIFEITYVLFFSW